jgi:hypothetical protein
LARFSVFAEFGPVVWGGMVRKTMHHNSAIGNFAGHRALCRGVALTSDDPCVVRIGCKKKRLSG